MGCGVWVWGVGCGCGVWGVGVGMGCGVWVFLVEFTNTQGRGGWTRSCDSLRDRGVLWILYGAACTKVVWSSFGQVLLSLYKKRILLESSCDALSEKRANPRVVAELRSFKDLAIGKARLHTGFYLLTERCCPSRSVPTIAQ